MRVGMVPVRRWWYALVRGVLATAACLVVGAAAGQETGPESGTLPGFLVRDYEAGDGHTCVATEAAASSRHRHARAGTGPACIVPAAQDLCGIGTASASPAKGTSVCARCGAPRRLTGEPTWSSSLLTTKRLTGDWGEKRTALRDGGVNISVLLGTTTQFNLRGGQNVHNAHETGGKMFYNLEFDFEKMGLVSGATFFVRGIQTWNSGIGADVGSLTPPYWSVGSSGDKEIELDKWWYRQRLFDDRLEFRFGKLLNTIDLFDRNVYAANYLNQFMNRALNHSTTIPSSKAIGAFVRIWPTDWLYVQALMIDPDMITTHNRHGTGGFDTAFHGQDRFRAFGEFGVLSAELPGAEGLLPGHYRFGWWLDPQGKTVFIDDSSPAPAERRRSDDMGFYFNFDQMLWKERDDPADRQGVGLFARYGWARADVNKINHFWSVGAAYRGLIPSRDADELGFGVAQSILSKRYRRAVNPLADRETVYELYYAVKIAPWCTVTPDVQLITNPGGRKDARDALIGGVRVKIAF